MDPAPPPPLPLDESHILLFVVGCPRSGTTWLQLLLAQHPAVATRNETNLFLYLDSLERRWEREKRGVHNRPMGLPEVLSDAEFYGFCTELAARTLGRIAESRPGARVVLEKTPVHVLHGRLILRLFPRAHFLHVIRDPRSVASSMLDAHATWGSHWAPNSLEDAARWWRRAIEAGRALQAATPRYQEVRYEAVIDDGPGTLERILRTLELPFPPGFAEQALQACHIDRLRSASKEVEAPWRLDREPEGFFRRGARDAWREEMAEDEIRAIEAVVGDLMVELGYALAYPPTPAAPPPGSGAPRRGWFRRSSA
jgi:hypothetical protein